MNKKKNNKGFTLVELIVVMAIMAILIGALAPQVVKYVEKARESKDMQLEQTLFTSVQTAIDSSKDTVAAITDSTVAGLPTAIQTEVTGVMGPSLDTDAKIIAKCKSKKVDHSSGVIKINYDPTTGAIKVQIGTLDEITN